MDRKIRVGDIVNFFTTFKPFMKDYESRNPGVIVAKQMTKCSTDTVSKSRVSAYILWANGDITREHGSYLEVS